MFQSSNSHSRESSSSHLPTRALALKVAAWYALIGALWILLSGRIVHSPGHNPEVAANLETLKGSLFVVITGALLYMTLDRYFRRIRHSAQSLQESDGQLRLIGDNLPDSYVYRYIVAPGGSRHFNYVSAGVSRVHGLAVADVLSDAGCLHSQVDPAQRAAYAAAEAASARDLTDFEMDLQIRRADGIPRVIHVRSHPRPLAGGGIQWDGFGLDVTERRAQEREVDRLNRLSATLNRVTEAIVHARSREDLFDSICDVAIGFGRFRHAWIGWLQPDGRKLECIVRKSSRPGAEELLPGMVSGCAIAAEAVCSGRSCFSNEMPQDERAECCHAASGSTLRSCAIIPFRFQQQVRGVLGICSEEPGFFNAEELRLLDSVALEISYALDRMHEEEKRRHAEASFQKSQASLEAALASMTDAVLISDPEGRYLDFNEAFVAFYRFKSREECTNRLAEFPGLLDVFLPAGEPAPLEQWPVSRALRGESGTGAEFTLRRRDTGDTWVGSYSYAPICNADGDIVGSVVTSRDITARMLVEEANRIQHKLASALAASSSLDEGLQLSLNTAIESAQLDSGGFYLLDEQTRALELRAHKGLSADFIRAISHCPPDSMEHRFVMMGQPAFGLYSELGIVLSEAKRKEGLRFVAVIPMLHEGRVIGCLNVASHVLDDIDPVLRKGLETIAAETAHAIVRMKAEQALSESEDRYRQLVEESPDMIWIEQDGRLAFINSTGVRLLGGKNKDQLIGKKLDELVHPDDLEAAATRVRRRLAGDTSAYPAEVRYIRLDGTIVPIEVGCTPVKFAGRPARQLISRDISERKRMEAQMRQAQKLEAIGQLAGGVAHDFNNILAAIIMRVDMMRMNPGLDAETMLGLKDLDREAHRAAALTRQLLMFSRRSVLAVKTLDLNEIVANLLKMLNRLIGEHIDLRFDGSAQIPSVQADSGMLEQVLMNLVVNARDAMPKGGRITIGTAAARFDEAQAGLNALRRPGSFVCLTVSDTGCGMDEETIKRIFDPFFTTKELGKGTGLGLATVHGIIAQHQGWVEVDSAVDRGSTFRVFLPAIAGKAVGRKAEPESGHAVRGTETVLIVEDDENVRRLAARVLRGLGYCVHEVGNGQEAMAFWKSHASEVDLLLTDMIMPEGITGLELVERLQAMKTGLKAIVSSGYSAEIVQAGAPTGAGVMFLPKPYENKVLARVVRECLDRKD